MGHQRNKCLLKVRQNRPNADRIYSVDSKRDELIKIKQSFFSRTWTFYWPKKMQKQRDKRHRWGHIFRASEKKKNTISCALVWSAHDEFMHMHDCIVSVFQSTWFATKMFLLQPSSAPSMGICSQRKNRVCAVLTPY